MNNKINRLHKNALALFTVTKLHPLKSYQVYKDKCDSIHTKNVCVLMTKMFKVYKNLSPTIVAEIFGAHHNNYNLRHSSFFSIFYVKTVYHGFESLFNLLSGG